MSCRVLGCAFIVDPQVLAQVQFHVLAHVLAQVPKDQTQLSLNQRKRRRAGHEDGPQVDSQQPTA